MISDDELKKLEAKRKVEYYNIGGVYCPVLDCDVTFHKKGWHHLRYRSKDHPRLRGDLTRRLTLFPWAKKIIRSDDCVIRVETYKKGVNFFLTKGKIQVMLSKETDSEIVYYFSISDHGRTKKTR